MRREKALNRKRYFVAAVIAFLTVFLLLALATADDASAATKARAEQSASYQQSVHCGDGFWWSCEKSQAPYPFCRHNPRPGAWDCYGGVTQRHSVKWWVYRHCHIYTYVPPSGLGISRGLYGCR